MILLRSVTAVLAALSLFGSATAVSLAHKLKRHGPGARDLLKRANSAPPHFVVYSDQWINNLPSVGSLKGYNVFVFSFWLTTGPTDMAEGWAELSNDQRQAFLDECHGAGISVMVSAFGETDTPTSDQQDSTATANNLASWVKQYKLDGVDIDYEDFVAFSDDGGSAESWLISFTRQLRSQLPQGEYLISHAPVAPWFSPNRWSGGGYLKVNQEVGSLIDWYNVQFYNQGTTEYTTCNGLLFQSSSNNPNSALFQIAANGVDQNKLVIGKPAKSSDATNGYMSVYKLAYCVKEAHQQRAWDAGVMTWEWPDATSQWIEIVRGNTF